MEEQAKMAKLGTPVNVYFYFFYLSPKSYGKNILKFFYINSIIFKKKIKVLNDN